MEAIDLQINAAQILPFHTDSQPILIDHSVLIKDGIIVDLLPQSQLNTQLAVRKTIELNNHILIPGLHNAYCSIGSRPFHHIASDLPLSLRLQNQLQPLQTKHLSEELVTVGSELALAEMFKTGTSNFNSQYHHSALSAQIAHKHNVNASMGYQLDPNKAQQSFEQQLAAFLTLRDDFKHRKGINFHVSIENITQLTPGQLSKLCGISNELGITLQLSLNPFNVAATSGSSKTSIFKLLKEQALLSPDLQLTNVFALTRQEIALIAQTKTQCIICPSAQIAHSAAMTPLDALANLNANISLGSNDYLSSNLNLLKETQLLAQLGQLEAGYAQRFNPEQLLSYALPQASPDSSSETALGAIAKGFKADIAAIESSAELDNACDPFEQIVYTANHLAASHLWIGGIEKVRDYQLTDIDHHYLLKHLNKWRNQFT